VGKVVGLDMIGLGVCCVKVGTIVIGAGSVGNIVICDVGDIVVGRSEGLDVNGVMVGTTNATGFIVGSDVDKSGVGAGVGSAISAAIVVGSCVGFDVTVA
jgi:hypothetical protein